MFDNTTFREVLEEMSPRQFENLVYDCVRAIGLRNLVWRTPGSDGGRDIEGELANIDVTGFETSQKWYIECKKFNRSIDWPTVWNKISYAESEGADVLFVVTNSNPSPACESQIEKWNASGKSPAIRVWRGYDLPRVLRSHGGVASAHGFTAADREYGAGALDLALVVSKLTHSAFSALVFEQDALCPLAAAASLTELLSQRLDDLENYGRFVPGPKVKSLRDFDWLTVNGSLTEWEDVGLRAALTFIHHILYGAKLVVTRTGNDAYIEFEGHSISSDLQVSEDLNTVLLWSGFELDPSTSRDGKFKLIQRLGCGQ